MTTQTGAGSRHRPHRGFRRNATASIAALALAAVAVALPAGGAVAGGGHGGGSGGHGGSDRVLLGYAADTWRSFDAMTDRRTGLPADNISGDLATPSAYTSPTNIGGYLWSTVAARDLGIISAREAHGRLATTLASLSRMERHAPSGMFYNWYAPSDGAKLTTWPDSGDPIDPFLSTVDNGWLAASLKVVGSADRKLARTADALYRSMDFGWFHDAAGGAAKAGIDDRLGLNRGGFWDAEPTNTCSVPGNYHDGGTPVYYTCHWYDTTVSEARIATYLGIANGQIPARDYYGTYRTMPVEGCDFAWQEQQPQGAWRTYGTGDGAADVFESSYEYGGVRVVPAWGGSMFEALMPDLFVPEAQWGPRSWGVNHPNTVHAQRYHGLDEAGYGYWGFSPAANPLGGYREYGVEGLGISSDGYGSDVEKTDVDRGYPGCRDGVNPEPTFGDGVVTPHASFLALPYDRDGALANLAGIKTDLGAYGPGGFLDSATVSGTVAQTYLSLDQSMIMGAILNAVQHDRLKQYFVDRQFERAVKPVVAAQVFSL